MMMSTNNDNNNDNNDNKIKYRSTNKQNQHTLIRYATKTSIEFGLIRSDQILPN
jgi:hypothetical protein